MNVSFSQLDRDINRFIAALQKVPKEVKRRSLQALKRVAIRNRDECVKRIPVDEGTARQRMVTNVSERGDVIDAAWGPGGDGMDYVQYLEFGTEYIAGGLVRQLGTGVDIPDTGAIHTWPAKEGEAIEKTSHSIDSNRQLFNREGTAVPGPQEQMPFMRPAFYTIKDWVQKQLFDAVAGKSNGG